MRTPLGRVRGMGAARSGTEHFWVQRLTACSNFLLVWFFVILIANLAGEPYQYVVTTLARPWIALPLLLFVLSVTTHMRIGMQVIIEDYVHGELSKVALIILNTFYAVAVAVSAGFAILKLGFGA